jgi:hypothetical protein
LKRFFDFRCVQPFADSCVIDASITDFDLLVLPMSRSDHAKRDMI